ncbi:MAG TPA: hypothetical protein VGG11_03455 [Xanthobacteraceae bacterium]|jgi:hypothetical protein
MSNVGFDDKDYSVVVKNRGPSKPVEVGDLSSQQIERDWAVVGLLSHHGGREQGWKSSAQAAIV